MINNALKTRYMQPYMQNIKYIQIKVEYLKKITLEVISWLISNVSIYLSLGILYYTPFQPIVCNRYDTVDILHMNILVFTFMFVLESEQVILWRYHFSPKFKSLINSTLEENLTFNQYIFSARWPHVAKNRDK